MNETKLTNYLIISAHCLKNVNGRGMLKYFMDEVRCLKPLVTVPFDDHNPMFRYHDTIRTTRNLTGRMILNVLRKPYNIMRHCKGLTLYALWQMWQLPVLGVWTMPQKRH